MLLNTHLNSFHIPSPNVETIHSSQPRHIQLTHDIKLGNWFHWWGQIVEYGPLDSKARMEQLHKENHKENDRIVASSQIREI